MATNKKPTVDKFTGDLGTRITVPAPPKLPGEFASERAKEDYRKQCEEYKSKNAITLTTEALRKMPLLLKRYQISEADPNCWYLLALNLACTFVTGFQPSRGEKGRPKGSKLQWNEITFAHLYRDVQKTITKRVNNGEGEAIYNACAELVWHEPWLSKCNGNPETLYKRYNESLKTELVQIIQAGNRDQLAILEIVLKYSPPQK